MTNKNIYISLGGLDPELIIKAAPDNKAQKKNSIWVKWAALAACFAVIVSAIIVVPMLREDDPGIVTPPNNNHNPIIFDANVSPENLIGSNSEFIVGSSTAIGSGISSAPPAFRFYVDIAVKARVVKNHPDTYYKLDISSKSRPTAYRLIQMETIEVISGENVPEYFLYLIPESVYVDMSIYDSLIISMSQLGVENYVLKNASQNRMECFDLLVFDDYQDHPELGNIIAFSDGVFDESLWKNENWIYGYQFGKHYLDNPELGDLVVARGDSENTVISAIKDQIKDWYPVTRQDTSVVTLNLKTQAAMDALDYVSPFKNGVFSQYFLDTAIIFRRYINGCQTEETIRIDLLTEEVTYSEIRYTKEDMEQIENISVHLSEKASEYSKVLPTPPHTDPEGKTLMCLSLYAWYVKVDGKLYGVIKTAWRYIEKADYNIEYYDDAYVLYDMSAGTSADISRDDLVNIVGERNVYMGEYGIGIEMPMC